MLAIVTPCKGRLPHVRRTAPLNAAQAPYVFVDYTCPQRSGDWVERHIPNSLVVRVPGTHAFNKSRAHNLGAKAAIDAGAGWLCFADADTIMKPGFIAWVDRHLKRGRFLIAGREHRDLTGLLVVTVKDYIGVNGFDEGFVGWGSEDIDMRIRLRLQLGLDYTYVPPGFLEPIEHGDELRNAYYHEQNIQFSNQRNMTIVIHRILAMTGDPSSLSRIDVRQLLGDPSVVQAAAQSIAS